MLFILMTVHFKVNLFTLFSLFSCLVQSSMN